MDFFTDLGIIFIDFVLVYLILNAFDAFITDIDPKLNGSSKKKHIIHNKINDLEIELRNEIHKLKYDPDIKWF